MLFGELAARLLIKMGDFVGLIEVRAPARRAYGPKFAHGIDRSMCKIRIDVLGARNRTESHRNPIL